MHVSIRDDVVRQAGYKSIGEGLKDLRLDSVEVEFFRDYTVWDPAGWNKISFTPASAAQTLRDAYGKKNIKICAFLLHNNFNCAEPPKEVQWVVDVIKTADALNIPAIRIDAITKGEKEEPFETRVGRFVDCMRKVIAATPDSRAGLGIENHGIQGNDPAFLKQVIERVGSGRLGVNMDTGNFYWYGFPLNEVYEILRSVAKYTKHTHVKNIRYPEETRQQKRANGWEYGKYVSPIYEGDIDHKQVVAILKDVGYNGPLTIEDECLGKLDGNQKKEVLRKDAVYLKSLLK
ncbi:MAG: sugar phosphate isomerase/epimerase [Kiritimatiellae bacterium]|jgi:sugar phosphate isomerase/epimerase|nr:sugar phosphate isomerase/epimerase [Kiritimatiellia bacterium]